MKWCVLYGYSARLDNLWGMIKFDLWVWAFTAYAFPPIFEQLGYPGIYEHWMKLSILGGGGGYQKCIDLLIGIGACLIFSNWTSKMRCTKILFGFIIYSYWKFLYFDPFDDKEIDFHAKMPQSRKML